MLDIKIDKFPIIIISSPRTGSTALAEVLSKKFNLRFFNEPEVNNRINDLINYESNSYVLKFHARSIKKYPKEIISKIENNDCFLIKIQRKDLVSQIASDYLAIFTQNYYYHSNTKINYGDHKINEMLVSSATTLVRTANTLLSNLSFKYDLEIYYEDIIDFLQNANSIITPKPLFYDKLKEIVKDKLK